MSIRVHNSEHFEELRQSALSNSSLPSKSRSTASPPNASDKMTASVLSKETHMKRMSMKHELYTKEQEAMQKKLAETIAENIQRQKSKKEGQYLKLQQEVEDGKILAKELREKLELQQQSKTRQFSRMHEEWTNGVFHKLNDPIVAKVQSMDGKQRSAERLKRTRNFWILPTKKADYSVTLSLKATGDLPVLSGQNVGRSDNLDVKLWSKGEFESTPYGYFHKMMNSTASSDGSKTYASHVKLDHYNIEKGPEVLRQELPKGKRTNFDGYKIPKTTFQIN
ncbi:hypothetical protein GQ600_19905 [Phytophthora cactorum]|nr:hypothetical protein GQ600_19905 [Phytophthora cactorum]